MKAIITIAALFGALTLQAQNTFTFKTKNAEIILLSEGQHTNDLTKLIGITAEIISKSAPNENFKSAVNAFLIRTEGKNILADTGLGRELFKNLDSFGVKPEQIDVIVLTHLHGDHIGGLVASNKATFPNAKLYLSNEEYKSANENAKKILAHYSENMILFEPGDGKPSKLAYGLKSMQGYGHTPGHTLYLIDDLIIWGDLTHAMAIQMPYPKVAITYDTNQEEAVKTRLKILSYITGKNLTVAGMHIPYPGLGNLEPDGKGGYIFTPVK